MNADQNLVFGILALQADLIRPDQFIKACAAWTTRKEEELGNLLVEFGWITADDEAELSRLLERKAQRQAGDVRAELSAVTDDLKRSLAALGDADIHQSLAGLAVPGEPEHPTVDRMRGPSDRYTLSRLHATGGIGRVWLARDANLGREVALKELRPERAGNSKIRKRFLQEAQITGQLEHPGVVPVYEMGRKSETDEPFYTMRFVEGRTLREAAFAFHQKRLEGKADQLELLSMLSAFVTVCNTVAYAHSRGVVHRDLKGHNVVLGNFGEVVVLDWGLAKLVDAPQPEDNSPAAMLDQEGLEKGDTAFGEALGTPGYMAPEQAAGRPDLVGYRTDVYGLGAILYEILTGQPPFQDSDTKRLLRRVEDEEPALPHEHWSEVPVALEAVCTHALAKRPDQRFSSPSELAREVQQWQEVQRQKAEEERDLLFSLSLDMLAVAGVDGYFKRLNPAWEKTLGWTVDELMARPYMEFIHPDDVASTTAEASRIYDGGRTLTFENRYRCKDGSYKWLLWTAISVVEDGLVYCSAKDFSERKGTEKALRDSEERYRSVITAMQDGIVLFDADGEITACNPSAERILGLSADEIGGRTSFDSRWRTVHEDGTPFAAEDYPVTVTLRTGQPCVDVIMGVYRPDGAVAWISINSRPLVRPGEAKPHAVMASFEDVSYQKQLEGALTQATAELEQYKQRLDSSQRKE